MKLVKNSLGLVTVLDCPYCSRTGEGIISVDAAAAMRRARRNAQMVDSKVGHGDSEGILIFNADRPSGHPCRHVIALLIDVEVKRHTRMGRVQRSLSYSGAFDHPWFAEHDDQNLYGEFLWTEINGGHARACHPVTPHKICRIGLEMQMDDSRYDFEISGTIFIAMHPETFFAELEGGYNRWQQD